MPVPTKASPMLADERLRTDDRDDLQDRRKPSIQLDKEQAIAVGKPDAGYAPCGASEPLDVAAKHLLVA